MRWRHVLDLISLERSKNQALVDSRESPAKTFARNGKKYFLLWIKAAF